MEIQCLSSQRTRTSTQTKIGAFLQHGVTRIEKCCFNKKYDKKYKETIQ